MRGGKRPGAGRPKAIEGTRRHFLYCTEEEYAQAKKRLEWEREKANPQIFMDDEDYVFDCLASFVPGQPIFLDKLFEDCHGRIESVERYRELVEKIAEENPRLKLRKYEEGIYYRTIQKRCRELRIDSRELFAIKYMKDDGWHTTGYDLLNKLGLVTLVPAYGEIVSNFVKENIVDEKFKVKIYPAKEEITAENRQYFTILDAVKMLKEPCIDADNPIKLIKDYIEKNKLEITKIREYANRSYDNETINNLSLCGG
ncbi:MAG: hypothetical protein J6N51_15570 [Selenomonas sp.]|nr:hypothetical protein [Selenomonas sp.]